MAKAWSTWNLPSWGLSHGTNKNSHAESPHRPPLADTVIETWHYFLLTQMEPHNFLNQCCHQSKEVSPIHQCWYANENVFANWNNQLDFWQSMWHMLLKGLTKGEPCNCPTSCPDIGPTTGLLVLWPAPPRSSSQADRWVEMKRTWGKGEKARSTTLITWEFSTVPARDIWNITPP